MMDCKRALEETGGDIEQAVELLRVKGQAQAAKRGARVASEGVVESYIHATGKIGVLVEVDCETDFVARNEDFRAFARDVALHIAAATPQYVSEDDVPEDAREAELRIFEEQAQDKPENVRAEDRRGPPAQVARGGRAAQPGARQRATSTTARRSRSCGPRPRRRPARTWSSAASRASRWARSRRERWSSAEARPTAAPPSAASC